MRRDGHLMAVQALNEHTIDFAKPEYPNPVMDMSEFFIENPQYRVLRYVPIEGGIRCWYVTVS